MSTVIEARRRHLGVTARQARDEKLGTALGRLAFRELISEEQYQAGLSFGQLYHRHHAALGLPMPNPRSVAGLLINEGMFGGSADEPDQEAINRLRRRFDDATNALDQLRSRSPVLKRWTANAAGLLSGLHGSRGVELAGRRHWPSAGRAQCAGTGVQA